MRNNKIIDKNLQKIYSMEKEDLEENKNLIDLIEKLADRVDEIDGDVIKRNIRDRYTSRRKNRKTN